MSTLPADLVQMREAARVKLREFQERELQRGRHIYLTAWGDVLHSARKVLPARLWDYFDELSTRKCLDVQGTWLFFQLPESWPILVYFTPGIEWTWTPLEQYDAEDDVTRPPMYAVIRDQGTQWEWTLGAVELGSALVLAERPVRLPDNCPEGQPPW